MSRTICTKYEAVTVGTAVATLSPPTNSGYHVEIVGFELACETDNVRYRMDGTSPTSSVGTPLNAGDTKWMDSGIEPSQVKLIRSGSANATVHVHYFERG